MEQKSVLIFLVGCIIGFACAFPVGYSAGHKTSEMIYQQKIKDAENRNSSKMITAAVEAQAPGSAKTVMEDYQRKNTWFQLPNASGGEIKLEYYKGKPVMIMFYTETCPYCRKAAPALEALHKKYSEKGLAVIGLCSESDKEAAIRFSQSLGTTFPMAYEAQRTARKYGVQGVPYIFLLDKNHEVAEVWPGFSSEYANEMENAINKALAS